MINEISETVLEALAELIKLNYRFSHPYYNEADKVQAGYEKRIKPVLEPFSSIRAVAEAINEREKIYREQKREKIGNNGY